MSKKIEKDIEKSYQHLTQLLAPLSIYFVKDGEIDTNKIQQDSNLKTEGLHVFYDILPAIIENRLSVIGDKQALGFCADAVHVQRVVVEDNKLMKFWGKVEWLNTPKNHDVNVTGYDPVYCEFIFEHNHILITKILFGDYDKLNIDKIYWFEREMNWMYELL